MTRRLLPLVGIALAALAAATAAQEAPVEPQPESQPEPQVVAVFEVAVTPAAVTVGDRFEARLTLRTETALTAAPRFPVWEEHWGKAEILEVAAPRDAGAGVWTQQLTLALFETGAASLPAVTVELPTAGETGRATSAPAIVQVDSVLPASDEEIAPQPPEAPHRLPAGRRFWTALALLGLACLVLAVMVLRKAREIHQALAALAMSPIEAFQSALARLRAESDAGRVYTGLSLELRRYLGRALGFPAAEGTTTQVQRALRERGLPTELVRGTLGLLREADQIKFARRAAEPTSTGRRLDDAEQLAAGIEQWLTPATDDGAEAA